jgi:hypothetical protein
VLYSIYDFLWYLQNSLGGSKPNRIAKTGYVYIWLREIVEHLRHYDNK